MKRQFPFDYIDKNTAVETVTFSNSSYERMVDGSLIRVDPPRPYRGKRDRKDTIKLRRRNKERRAAMAT